MPKWSPSPQAKTRAGANRRAPAILQPMLPKEQDAAEQRRVCNLKQNESSEKVSRSEEEGRARDKIGAFPGVSGGPIDYANVDPDRRRGHWARTIGRRRRSIS